MQAEILSSEFIRDALHRFEQRGLPIGKVLVMSGYLSENELRNALEVQSLVNDGHLPLEVAIEVLKLSHKENISLSDAFQRSGLVLPEDQETNRLGHLLVAAGIVTDRELEEALQINVRTGLPLGHAFCFRGYLSQAILYTTLLAQETIRRGAISRNNAIQAIAQAFKRETTLEKLDINKGFQRLPMKQALRLGEMLVEAKVLVDKLLPDALLRSLQMQRPIGEVLVQSRFVSEELVNRAVDMQEMIDNGTLLQAQASEVLLSMKASDTPYLKALGHACTFRARQNMATPLVEILTSSGIIQQAKIPREIQERLTLNYNQVQDVTKLLLEHELVEETILYSAMRLTYLTDIRFINLEQAIVIIELHRKTKQHVDEILHNFGWVARTRLKTPG